MKILLLYHFFHPDFVVSARIFSDLAEDLVKAGHEVSVFTGNRLFRSGEALPLNEIWNGVEIRRFARPNLSQKKNVGRIVNSVLLQAKWLRAFWARRKEFDAVILGTDPQFGYLMFAWLRLMNRKVRLIHWVFDVYPEAVLACSSRWMKIPAILMKPWARFCYRFVDDMVDIGSCMRKLMSRHYHFSSRSTTLTPWSLLAPESIPEQDPETRREFFGDAKIGLLYSGSIGHAHDLSPLIDLARECRKRGLSVAFCFAGFGNCYEEQIRKITAEDTNIRVAGLASEKDLEKRLAAADIHMISLRPEWAGVVLPSKFFGSIAMGRPILFSGPDDCVLADWCSKYQVGLPLAEDTADRLAELVQDPSILEQWKKNAFAVNKAHFSRERVVAGWLKLLQGESR